MKSANLLSWVCYTNFHLWADIIFLAIFVLHESYYNTFTFSSWPSLPVTLDCQPAASYLTFHNTEKPLRTMSISSELEILALSKRSSEVNTQHCHSFFGSSGYFSSVYTEEEPDLPADLIAILGLIQQLNIPFLHITWDPGLDDLGEGATSEVHQSLVSNSINFAYKRARHTTPAAFQALMCEMTVLRSPIVQQHPNMLQLHGICWNEVQDDEVDGGVKPILVFEKAQYGNLEDFLGSAVGKNLVFNTRLKLCRGIASALLAMHSSGK
jgi:hypothetical protein